MTREGKKTAYRRTKPVNESRSGVPRVLKRTTLRDMSKESANSTIEEQVAALKKIPADRIGDNELETKSAETKARLREVLSENARLTSVAESARKETEKYRQLNAKIIEENRRVIESRNESDQQRQKAESTIEGLQNEIQALQKDLAEKTRAAKRVGYLRVQPDQMVEMITDFKFVISNSLSGLTLSNLELRLKVAVDTEEDRTILLIPPITSGKVNSDRINELIVRVLPSGVIGIA